jgi:S1-C subfamily serine protease
MKLNLAIIHLDMVIDTLELEEGEYTIGRSSQNNIVVQHFSLEPVHGKIYSEDGNWFFAGAQGGKQRISHGQPLVLSSQIQLATQEHVESSSARLTSLSALQSHQQAKLNKRLMVVALLIFVMGASTIGGYQLFRDQKTVVSQNRLLNRVRTKIVEFEIKPDQQAIEEYKTYGNLTDDDFKENSGFCTGFLMGPNVVLTAAHCLLGSMIIDLNKDFYLKTHDGKKHEVVEILGFDIKRDFLYLRTQGMEDYGHLNFADSYEIEQRVFTVGNVHGEGIAIRDGIISSESIDPDEPDVKFIRYSAGTSPGNSGGPLLNQKGEVIALVFASTYSENFNLGTSIEDLKPAYQEFVNHPEGGQTLNIAIKRLLNFKAAPLLQSLSIPYLPQFDEHPEVADLLKSIAIDIQVPIEFDKMDEVILAPLNKAVIETYLKVQELLEQKGELTLDWGSFVSEEVPAVLPSQFDGSQNVFVKKNGRYYPYVAGLIDSPSKSDFVKYKRQFKKENKFDFQAYGYNIYLNDSPTDLLPSDIFYKPKDESGNKQRIQNLAYGAPHSQLLVKLPDDIRTPGFYSLKLFLKNFAGEGGVLASVNSRFVRPQSAKDFLIQDFNLDPEKIQTKEVKDRWGRVWLRSRVRLFESLNVLTYCTEMPEGTFCTGRAVNVFNNYLLGLIENNFRQFILSHLLINPYFWSPSSLGQFISEGRAQTFPLMGGLSLQVKNDSLLGSLSPLPLDFELPNAKKIQSVRPLSGLYHQDGSAQWTGFGIDWVQIEESKDLVCGLGVEIYESQSAFILNFLRDRKKQEKMKKIKGEDPKPLPGIWYKPFRGLKVPFQIYGYCAPLEEDPRVSDQYFVDFKNAKPLIFKHNVRIGEKN